PTAVAAREPMAALTRLLDQVAAAGVPARVARLDRAFFAVAAAQLLRARGIPSVTPAVIRGRKPRPGAPATGLRAARRAARRAGAGRPGPGWWRPTSRTGTAGPGGGTPASSCTRPGGCRATRSRSGTGTGDGSGSRPATGNSARLGPGRHPPGGVIRVL